MPDHREAPVEVMRRLCEAVDAAAAAADDPRGCPPELFQRTFNERCDALTAYRAAIAPKRTRAEVDAEIVTRVRARVLASQGLPDIIQGETLSRDLFALCREDTAPEPAHTFHQRAAEALGLMDGDQGRYIYADEERCLLELRRNRLDAESWRERSTALDVDFPAPDACGCEASDELRDTVTELRRLLGAIHGFGKSIVELSEEVP